MLIFTKPQNKVIKVAITKIMGNSETIFQFIKRLNFTIFPTIQSKDLNINH